MPQLSFPASPTVGQTSTQNGRQYVWSGYAWELVAASSDDARWDYFKPAAPTSVTATAGNAQAVVSWTAPAIVVPPLTDYVVQYSSDSGGNWTTVSDGTSTATTATVTGLTNDVAVQFRVAGTNGIGTGAYSTASAAVTPIAVSFIPIPTMTSNTLPSGVVSSNDYRYNMGADFLPFRAFDGNAATEWASANASSEGVYFPHWIQYDFVTSPSRITGYTLSHANYSNPTSWDLSGSNNGTTFTVIDSRPSGGLSYGGTATFSLSEPAVYRIYRLTFYSASAEVWVTLATFQLTG